MNHAELVRRVTAMAASRGLLVHYCGDGRRCKGDNGFPDLVLAGPGGVAFIEGKTGGQLEPGQHEWRDMLLASGAMWLRVDPVDLWNGKVVRALDQLARR